MLNAQIFEKDVTIEATEEVKEFLCEQGYKPAFGAREMARVFHKFIKQELAELMLFGDLQEGGTVLLELNPQYTEFQKEKNAVSSKPSKDTEEPKPLLFTLKEKSAKTQADS